MIQSIRGTKDLLPENISQWDYIESIFRKISGLFSFKEIRTPIFEKTEVFSRSIGDASDIVNKEMYTFVDKGGESVTLRPEMTAAVVRSIIQNSLLSKNPVLKLWYFGPFFRYERPQKGRLRQFHQYGAECIGSPYPESDAETILLACGIIDKLGIKDYKLFLNTLGNDNTRSAYREALVNYFISHSDKLSYDSRNRLSLNPLRILDSKDEGDKAIINEAPVILDYLDDESASHFETVKSMLDSSGINYIIEPRIVRGLDYYNHTVFEFQSSALGSQDSFGGGGRYNTLFTQLGGKDTPAVGFAMGVERLLMILESSELFPEINDYTDLYVVTNNPEFSGKALEIASIFRKRGFSAQCDLSRKSLKAQFRDSNKYNAKYVVIIAEEEISRNCVILKNMSNSEQREIEIDKLNDIEI